MITGNEPITGLENQIGLTIRQHFAAIAMQGIVQQYELDYTTESTPNGYYPQVALQAVKMADALIAELNK